MIIKVFIILFLLFLWRQGTKTNQKVFFQISAMYFHYLTKITKRPPTSFPPVTSANVGFGHQNFLTFSFNPFATLVQNFKFVPSASPNLLNFNQDHPSKKRFFWSNPYKIEDMITFLKEMLQLPNFGHMTTSIM